jgi:hypothetical protein
MIPRVGTALPIDGSFGEVIKGTQTMLRAFGWDLGRFYDDKMRPQHGDDWLKKLVEVRRQQFPDVPMYKKVPNLWDPNFGVNEPAKNLDSPLKQCLGPMPLDVWSKFKSIPFKFRNREQHFDEVPALETLRADAELIRAVASFLGLPVAQEASELIARVDDLEGGAIFRGSPDEMMKELARELEEYQAKHKAQPAFRSYSGSGGMVVGIVAGQDAGGWSTARNSLGTRFVVCLGSDLAGAALGLVTCSCVRRRGGTRTAPRSGTCSWRTTSGTRPARPPAPRCSTTSVGPRSWTEPASSG